jgi:glycosyltransferase involved in cell wall biosynthesis
MFSASLKLILSNDDTPVWTHTTPPFLGILLAHICSWKKRRFLYILHDIFPEGLIRLDKVSRRNLFIKLWQRLFVKALIKSEKIIVIGRDIERYIVEICLDCQDKIEYIPVWQDDNLIFPVEFETNKFIIEHRLKDKFVVQYSGNMGLWNEVKTMGQAVRQNLKDVFFIFIGDGLRKAELLKEFSVENQQNVLLLPFQSNSNFNNLLTASHVHLVTLRDGLEGIAVPCKIYGILAAGKPVIAMVPEYSEISYIVSEEKCGLVINPGDLNGLMNAIILLKNDEKLRSQMGQNGRKAFEKKYSVKIVVEKYKTLLFKII